MKEQSSIKFVVAAALALILLVPMMAGTGMKAANAATPTGIMVPLYAYPGGTWDTIIQTKHDHPNVPIVAIVNPASGPGGSRDSNYASGIDKLKASGVIVIGYVSTAYTGRSLTAVESDIDRWASWYNVGGIFFDEQTNWAGGESYYTEAGNYAKAKGLGFTVGNPGANSIPSYLSTVDVVLIYESPGLPNLSNYLSWDSYDNAHLGMIPFGVGSLPTAWVQDASKMIGWIYVTSDVLPNPWDSLPSYLGNMAALLDGGSSSGGNPAYELTVKSVDQNGNAINGMWMEVKQNGVTIRTGFSPLTTTLNRATYTVSAGNYQQITFDHWSDGTKSSTISTYLASNTVLTAYYNNGPIIPPLSTILTADKTTAAAGTSITFSAKIQGGIGPYSWLINYGDSTTSTYTSASTISKTYSAAGTYAALATARDATGKTITSNPVALTITQSTSTLNVKTVNAAGSPINGYYTTLWQNGVPVKSAFSPTAFTLNNGQTYQVSVGDYGDYIFDHWDDGTKSRTRQVTMNADSAITAYYSAVPTEVTVSIKSVALDGSPITGLWTVVSGASSVTGFTPLSYTATTGVQYTISVGEWANYVFDHWDNGSTSKSRTINLNSNTVLTAYYRQ